MVAPSDAELLGALAMYDDALALRAATSKSSHDLIALETWFRVDLRALLVERRAAKTGVYLTRDELAHVMRWKLAHGKWRPRLQQLAESNDSDLVLSVTKEAALASTPAAAIKILSTLAGIGPATASAIVSAFLPDSEPFFSDEAVEVMGLGKAVYTVKALTAYCAAMKARVSAFESMEDLEKACWAHVTLERDKAKPAKKRPAENEVAGQGKGAKTAKRS